MTLNKNEKLISKKRKETYWCYEHNRFHRYKYKGKPSQTWLNCLNTNNFGGYKKDMTDTQILAHTLPKSLKRYSIESHKKTIGSMKQ